MKKPGRPAIDPVLSIGDVAKATGLGVRTVHRAVADGTFPAPIRLTTQRVGWKSSDVQRWIDTRPTVR